MASPGIHLDNGQQDVTPQQAFNEAQKWIEEVTGKSFGDRDFRSGLENGILLCELLNAIKPGLVKKINKLPTPISGLDNITLFLRGCKEFGLKESQLFDPGDLQDTSNRATVKGLDGNRKLKNVLVTIYWLGKAANNCTSYCGATLNLKEFEGLLVQMRKEAEDVDSPKRSIRDSGYIDCWDSERSDSLSPPRHGRDDSFDSLDSFGSRSQQTPSPDVILRGSSDGRGSDSEPDVPHRKIPDVRKDDMSARRSSTSEPKAAMPFNQYLPNKNNPVCYMPAPLRKKRAEREEYRKSWSTATSPLGGERPFSQNQPEVMTKEQPPMKVTQKSIYDKADITASGKQSSRINPEPKQDCIPKRSAEDWGAYPAQKQGGSPVLLSKDKEERERNKLKRLEEAGIKIMPAYKRYGSSKKPCDVDQTTPDIILRRDNSFLESCQGKESDSESEEEQKVPDIENDDFAARRARLSQSFRPRMPQNQCVPLLAQTDAGQKSSKSKIQPEDTSHTLIITRKENPFLKSQQDESEDEEEQARVPDVKRDDLAKRKTQRIITLKTDSQDLIKVCVTQADMEKWDKLKISSDARDQKCEPGGHKYHTETQHEITPNVLSQGDFTSSTTRASKKPAGSRQRFVHFGPVTEIDQIKWDDVSTVKENTECEQEAKVYSGHSVVCSLGDAVVPNGSSSVQYSSSKDSAHTSPDHSSCLARSCSPDFCRRMPSPVSAACTGGQMEKSYRSPKWLPNNKKEDEQYGVTNVEIGNTVAIHSTDIQHEMEQTCGQTLPVLVLPQHKKDLIKGNLKNEHTRRETEDERQQINPSDILSTVEYPQKTPSPVATTEIIIQAENSFRSDNQCEDYEEEEGGEQKGEDEDTRLPDPEKDDMLVRRTGAFQKQTSSSFSQFLPIPASQRQKKEVLKSCLKKDSKMRRPVDSYSSNQPERIPSPTSTSYSLNLEKNLLRAATYQQHEQEEEGQWEEEGEAVEINLPDLEKDDMMARRAGVSQKKKSGPAFNRFLPVPVSQFQTADSSRQPGKHDDKGFRPVDSYSSNQPERMPSPTSTSYSLNLEKNPLRAATYQQHEQEEEEQWEEEGEVEEISVPFSEKDDMMARRTGVSQKKKSGPAFNRFLPVPVSQFQKADSSRQPRKHEDKGFRPIDSYSSNQPERMPSPTSTSYYLNLEKNLLRAATYQQHEQEEEEQWEEEGEVEEISVPFSEKDDMMARRTGVSQKKKSGPAFNQFLPVPVSQFQTADSSRLPGKHDNKGFRFNIRTAVSDDSESASMYDMRLEDEMMQPHSRARYEHLQNIHNQMKEEEDKWQDDLARWKSRRRSASQDLIKKEEERKKLERLMSGEEDALGRRKSIKTYREIVEEKEHRERALHEAYKNAKTQEEAQKILQKYVERFSISEAVLERLQMPKLLERSQSADSDSSSSSPTKDMDPMKYLRQQSLPTPKFTATVETTISSSSLVVRSQAERTSPTKIASKAVPVLTPKPYSQPKNAQQTLKSFKVDGQNHVNGHSTEDVNGVEEERECLPMKFSPSLTRSQMFEGVAKVDKSPVKCRTEYCTEKAVTKISQPNKYQASGLQEEDSKQLDSLHASQTDEMIFEASSPTYSSTSVTKTDTTNYSNPETRTSFVLSRTERKQDHGRTEGSPTKNETVEKYNRAELPVCQSERAHEGTELLLSKSAQYYATELPVNKSRREHDRTEVRVLTPERVQNHNRSDLLVVKNEGKQELERKELLIRQQAYVSRSTEQEGGVMNEFLKTTPETDSQITSHTPSSYATAAAAEKASNIEAHTNRLLRLHQQAESRNSEKSTIIIPPLNLPKRFDLWSWDPEEERKRQEKWQKEQERLLQEKYEKEQKKLKEEWEKAQKEVEEEERRYHEEERKIIEETNTPLTPLGSRHFSPFLDSQHTVEEKSDTDPASRSVMQSRYTQEGQGSHVSRQVVETENCHRKEERMKEDWRKWEQSWNQECDTKAKDELRMEEKSVKDCLANRSNGTEQISGQQENTSHVTDNSLHVRRDIRFVQDGSWSPQPLTRQPQLSPDVRKKTASLDRNWSQPVNSMGGLRRSGSHENLASGQSPQNPSPNRSVSGKKLCSTCGLPLGKGAAMIIETLSLYFHIQCFRCGVCKGPLGDATTGTDVRIRNGLLNCNECYVRSRSAGQPTTL
ncbi:LIM and calponin homology domains-containing protein 1 isoform X2 [Protopterus annectens]|uniref:LIM and calponin homology domains-containing protein 1 isoform X2 n=1 Tax=Protopterus annectens TaxID=7888 RepID=UPI001CFBD972|nr:LIM and calponin homology domains-containing protein 1 isoform X2 [Protopterus annectens]